MLAFREWVSQSVGRIPGKKPWHRARVTSVLPLCILDLIDGRIGLGRLISCYCLGLASLPVPEAGAGGIAQYMRAYHENQSSCLKLFCLGGAPYEPRTLKKKGSSIHSCDA